MEFLFALILLPFTSVWSLYVALGAVLVLSGLGLPVPEEATLLFGGYMAYLGILAFWPTLYTLMAGILIADLVGYALGRFGTPWVWEKTFKRWRRADALLEKARRYFERHGEKVVFLSRPLVGVRVAVPILAGHFKMNPVKFAVFDLLAAIPWTFALVGISYYLGSGIDLIIEVREVKYLMFAVVGVSVIVYSTVRWLQKRIAALASTK